jgi:hypothetical protein
MPKDREALVRLRPAGDWRPKFAVDNTLDDLHFTLRRDVACGARAAQEAHDAMASLLKVAPAAMLARKPEFMTLVRTFAELFEQLTEAVDAAMQVGVPWRDLVTECPRILAALNASIENERQISGSRAYSRYLREGGPSPRS